MDRTDTGIRDMLVALTADIVSAHVSNNALQVSEVPGLVSSVHAALASLGEPETAAQELPTPAVSVRASVRKDHLVCLEDGKRMKMLKRHLRTEHGLTPDEYRARWRLPADYPMVASAYAASRRELAVKIGLGRKPGQKRGRPPKQSRQGQRRAHCGGGSEPF